MLLAKTSYELGLEEEETISYCNQALRLMKKKRGTEWEENRAFTMYIRGVCYYSREEIAEEQPVPPTGDILSLLKWIVKHIKYPERAAKNGVQGRVIVRFVVEKDGSLTHVQVAKPVDPDLDKEAIRVVKSMGKWKPGMQCGKPVRSRYTLPIQFNLQ